MSPSPEGLAGPPFLIIAEGVRGRQLRRDPQGQFESREETFQRYLVLQLVLQICQLQQLLLPLPVQPLLKFTADRLDLTSHLSALRFLEEPLVQDHHVMFYVYRLLFSDT